MSRLYETVSVMSSRLILHTRLSFHPEGVDDIGGTRAGVGVLQGVHKNFHENVTGMSY